MKPLVNITDISRSRNTTDFGEGSLMDVIAKYKGSYFWKDLAPRTKQDYNAYLALIQEWAIQNNHPHIKNISAQDILKWLSYFEDTPVRQKRAKDVLSRVYTVAIQFDFIQRNIVAQIKLRRRQTVKRKLVIWEDEHVEKFLETVDSCGRSSMGTAVMIAYYTGQRQGDILRLRQPDNYLEGFMNVLQSKTGKKVKIPVMPELEERLKMIPQAQSLLVLNERTGKQWTSQNFTHVFQEQSEAAGLTEHWFMELRHSCVHRLNRAGCTPTQIAAITGHSLNTINTMLANHYLELRDAEVAAEAITKLQSYSAEKGLRDD